MLKKTKGLIIKTFKYKDSSLIAKIFTREYGMLSFVLPGIKSRKKNSQIALFQSMNILDLIIYYKEDKQLHYVRESKVQQIVLSSDISKTSIFMFLNEVLYHSIPEEPNVLLFDFFENQIISLLEERQSIRVFHLHFMIEYLSLLGLKPLNNYSLTKPYFNLKNGSFENTKTLENLDKEVSLLLYKLLILEDSELSSEEREQLLEMLMNYFQEHISGFPVLKSHRVLKTILH